MEWDHKKRFLLITAVGMGMLLNPLNTTMISVAFARLQEDFQVTFADISWLIATFYLASAIGQPVMGKLSDLFGRKRMFLMGLLLVTGSSIMAPFSPSFHWLLAFRVVQAIGTSSIFPSGMGMIRSIITENQARALGMLSIFSSTSAALGPSIGGLLIHYGDWPAIFFINFPVIAVSFILAVKIMPADPKTKGRNIRIDIWGIIIFALMIFLWLLFLLSLGNGPNWWELGFGLVVTVLFYWYEARRKQPFVDVHFLKNNVNVSFIYLQFVMVNVIFYSITFGIPIYLQNVRHFDVQKTGLIMLALAAFSVLITPLSARWLDKKGTKHPLAAGNVLIVAGCILLMALQEDSPAAIIFLTLSVLGIAVGMLNLSLQTGLYTFVSTAETGIASGLFMTSRFVGTILSSSLLGVVFGKEIATAQLHGMAIVCAVISLLMLMLTFRLPQAKQLPLQG